MQSDTLDILNAEHIYVLNPNKSLNCKNVQRQGELQYGLGPQMIKQSTIWLRSTGDKVQLAKYGMSPQLAIAYKLGSEAGSFSFTPIFPTGFFKVKGF